MCEAKSWELGLVIEKWSSRDPRPAMTSKILSVDIVHGQAAQVLLDFDGRYVDLLQLIKAKGEWRIVNKVYVPVPERGEKSRSSGPDYSFDQEVAAEQRAEVEERSCREGQQAKP